MAKNNIIFMTDKPLVILLVGSASVGKTCIINRITYNEFNDTAQSTINPTFYTFDRNVGNALYKFQFRDTAGQERFSAINKQTYHGSDAVIIVYSIDNPESAEKIQYHYNQIFEVLSEDTPVFLAANKIDLLDELDAQELIDQGEKEANDLSISFFKVSAKSGNGIDELIDSVAENCVQKSLNKKNDKVEVVDLKQSDVIDKEKGDSCC